MSCLAWCKTPGPPSLAIGHCSPEFLGSLDEVGGGLLVLGSHVLLDRHAPTLTWQTSRTQTVQKQVMMSCNVIMKLQYDPHLPPVFTAPSHVTVLDYCDKQSNLLAAGCTSGQVDHL